MFEQHLGDVHKYHSQREPGSSAQDAAGQAAESAVPIPLDFQSLVERCLGHLELVERVLTNFEERFWPDVSQIEEALAARDATQITRVAHQLKGASANVSAEGLQEIMAQIEQSSRTGQLEVIPSYLERLRHEWEKVVQHLANVSPGNRS